MKATTTGSMKGLALITKGISSMKGLAVTTKGMEALVLSTTRISNMMEGSIKGMTIIIEGEVLRRKNRKILQTEGIYQREK
jgi:hypothetical protein